MKTNLIYRITSLVMALMIFISSVGFSADVHFCKGEFKSMSIFGEASSCHTAKKSCPHHQEKKVHEEKEKDCCKNQKFEVEDLDTDFSVAVDVELTDLEFKFIASLVYSFFNLAPPQVVKSTFLEKKVQLPSRDIYVLLGRYLL